MLVDSAQTVTVRRKRKEEAKRKRKEEEEENRKTEEEEKKRKRRHISPSSLSRRVTVGMRKRRQPELYTPEDYRYQKATKANVSTSESIFVDSQESIDTLPMGMKEERRDYVTREVLGVDEKSLIERFLNECIINEYVEELRRYMKGKHIDAENWSLCYPDPCPQQGSRDDCAIFTCKYMECLARRDTQGLPFSQDDMPNVRAKFALHFIKAYFNAQERSELEHEENDEGRGEGAAGGTEDGEVYIWVDKDARFKPVDVDTISSVKPNREDRSGKRSRGNRMHRSSLIARLNRLGVAPLCRPVGFLFYFN
ncbi:hypothetical protein Taro_011664 [Colocasia esculenta]|uniref:Ubiquitin-like protease family profile domain-containing protein n=1 Tax=Colocasia esculenta TaxID=4460 RepID=A0A843UBA0_COLES|nr:hypothetical protein [Colocasia esculenta]